MENDFAIREEKASDMAKALLDGPRTTNHEELD
jgi:hypothetical protein